MLDIYVFYELPISVRQIDHFLIDLWSYVVNIFLSVSTFFNFAYNVSCKTKVKFYELNFSVFSFMAFVSLWPLCLTQDLSCRPGIEPLPPAVDMESPNH